VDSRNPVATSPLVKAFKAVRWPAAEESEEEAEAGANVRGILSGHTQEAHRVMKSNEAKGKMVVTL
jgi:hypothetical protein